MKMTEESEAKYYELCVRRWDAADRECRRLYVLWQAANDQRAGLAVVKNNAWKCLNEAREAETA